MALDEAVERREYQFMEPAGSMRVDKWLWGVRIFRARSLAAEACRALQVRILDHPVRPSREVRVGEILFVHKEGIVRQYKVLGFPPQRVGAQAALECCEDLTPPEELARLKERREQAGQMIFPKGQGRPSKKNRRAVEALMNWTGVEGND